MRTCLSDEDIFSETTSESRDLKGRANSVSVVLSRPSKDDAWLSVSPSDEWRTSFSGDTFEKTPSEAGSIAG